MIHARAGRWGTAAPIGTGRRHGTRVPHLGNGEGSTRLQRRRRAKGRATGVCPQRLGTPCPARPRARQASPPQNVPVPKLRGVGAPAPGAKRVRPFGTKGYASDGAAVVMGRRGARRRDGPRGRMQRRPCRTRTPNAQGSHAAVSISTTLPGRATRARTRRRRDWAASRRYRPLETRASGGFGSVEICLDSRLQRRVAIKRIPSRTAPRGRHHGRRTCRGAHREHAAAPHIVSMIDFTYDAAYAYLVMEYVDGMSLGGVPRAGRRPFAHLRRGGVHRRRARAGPRLRARERARCTSTSSPPTS